MTEVIQTCHCKGDLFKVVRKETHTVTRCVACGNDTFASDVGLVKKVDQIPAEPIMLNGG